MKLDKGTVCIKTAGKEAGEKAVVLERPDETFAVIIGPRIKKRKCNISHLIPTGETIEVTKNITQKDLAEKLK
ncbi:MAG: 50S ribosomal protein L14e [Candidatus Diapherotrites archaeon CG11_big_fil_rev_8_21_14_0_20_37_9]|nr:MAG: 50S ribosomal protein L14e [Candidatus Diapherotrites archaeon CG11_big_fil_rev_8_21_14_0_20_37_9]